MERFQGYLRLILFLKTIPLPIFAPNARRRAALNDEDQGNQVRKKMRFATSQTSRCVGEPPGSYKRLSNAANRTRPRSLMPQRRQPRARLVRPWTSTKAETCRQI